MLCSLYIENIALIRKLSFEPSGGFCAFTGETGAGKSIIIDALSLLCGARSDRDIIRTGEDYALVEGVFFADRDAENILESIDITPEEDGNITITRRISIDGRSVSKINGRAVPLSKLKLLSSQLISIHGQQDTYAFSDKARQLSLLDAYAKNNNILDAYKKDYTDYREICKRLEELKQDDSERERRADMLRYRIAEIKRADVKKGEQSELEETRKRLANAEKIVSNSEKAYSLLYGSDGSALELIDGACDSVSSLRGIIDEADSLSQRLENVSAEIKDIAETLNGYKEEDGEDPQKRLDETETRLEEIKILTRKYRTDADDFSELLSKWEKEAENLENSEEMIEELEKELEKAEKKLEHSSLLLTESRKKAAEKLSQKVAFELADLDMPNVKFEVAFGRKDFSNDGIDSIEFLVSANKGEKPRPMAMCASGGELSRIMLCLKCVFADSEKIGTLIFDEIDAGVSGGTSEKIGLRLKKASDNGKTQIICVTHSAVLASKADAHYRISKSVIGNRTETEITKLEGKERVDEIARILGGVNITDTVRAAATELLCKK